MNKTLETLEVLVEGTLIVPPMNALPAKPSPPFTTKAPVLVDVDTVLFEINKFEIFEAVVEGTYTVPPIKAFPVTPRPPNIEKAAVIVEDALVAPRIVTPVPTATIKFVELTDAPVPA